MEVPRVHTPIEWATAGGELARAYRAMTGQALPPLAVPYLLAMLHVENRGGDAVYNHNWGNVTTTSDAVPYYYHEGIPLRFRSLPSHQDGARVFLETMRNRVNRPAFQAAARDDFDAWFGEIRDHYAAPPPGHQGLTEAHRGSYRYLVDKFRGNVSSRRSPSRTHAAGGADGSGALVLLALVGAGAWIWHSYRGRGRRRKAKRNV